MDIDREILNQISFMEVMNIEPGAVVLGSNHYNNLLDRILGYIPIDKENVSPVQFSGYTLFIIEDKQNVESIKVLGGLK